jgi:hypothetical protein
MEKVYEVYTFPSWEIADRIERLIGDSMTPSISRDFLEAEVHGVTVEIDINYGFVAFYGDNKPVLEALSDRLLAGIEIVD